MARRERILIMVLLIWGANSGKAQIDTSLITGLVTYVTSSNVYVRLGTQNGMNIGDTLYHFSDDQYTPGIKIIKVSSISSVGEPLTNYEFAKDDQVFKLVINRSKLENKGHERDTTFSKTNERVESSENIGQTQRELDSLLTLPIYESKFRGRVSVSSHSVLFNEGEEFNTRMRYSLSLRNDHVNNSAFSYESYAAYRHNMGPNTESNTSRSEALRVYSLALRYHINPKTEISLGRRINRNLANVGAIDGIQGEHQFGEFSVGAAMGWRPDIYNYGLNTKLLEYGAFLAHRKDTESGYFHSSIAFFEQRNAGEIDRRFTYFQHSSSPIKKLNLFTSFEVDWYQIVDQKTSFTPRLSSLFLSLRYRFSRSFDVTTSYDNRNNIIYYETYKSQIDQLLEDATRQGFRMRVNIRPVKKMTVGLSGGYRFQKDNPNDSKNAYVYVNYSQIPWLKANFSLTFNWIENGYSSGFVYGARINRDLIKRRLSGTFQYRFADYSFSLSERKQNIYTCNLIWRILKRLSLSVSYEATIEEANQYHRVHLNLIQRF